MRCSVASCLLMVTLLCMPAEADDEEDDRKLGWHDKAEPRLPVEVVEDGIGVSKQANALVQIIAVVAEGDRYDETYVYNYADISIREALRRIPGVGRVSAYGSRPYSMRVWLDPLKLAALGMSVNEVRAAIKEQNTAFSGGTIGAEISGQDVDLVFPVTAVGRFLERCTRCTRHVHRHPRPVARRGEALPNPRRRLGGCGGEHRAERRFSEGVMTTRHSTVLTLLLLAGSVAGCASARPDAAPPPSDDRVLVVLLGTGTPNAEPDRAGSSLAVVVGDRAYLVDCGPGVVRRANAAARAGVAALAPEKLGRAFITHLHSDHTLGLPDLVLTPWTLGREHPLEIWGPPGLEAMTEHIVAAWRADVDIRLNGLEPANPDGWQVLAYEILPGEAYQDEAVTVEAFAVPHGAFEHAYGYRFTTPEGVVVISGDTAAFDGMAEAARGAALLVHEAYASAGWQRRDPLWQRYHAASHTPGPKVGELATAAGVGAVVLTHQLLWGATEEELVAEVRAAYDGPVFYGRDLDVFLIHDGAATLLP